MFTCQVGRLCMSVAADISDIAFQSAQQALQSMKLNPGSAAIGVSPTSSPIKASWSSRNSPAAVAAASPAGDTFGSTAIYVVHGHSPSKPEATGFEEQAAFSMPAANAPAAGAVGQQAVRSMPVAQATVAGTEVQQGLQGSPQQSVPSRPAVDAGMISSPSKDIGIPTSLGHRRTSTWAPDTGNAGGYHACTCAAVCTLPDTGCSSTAPGQLRQGAVCLTLVK